MNYCLNPKCPNPTDPMTPKDSVFCRHCGASFILPNRYRVTQVLGSGGFSKTYEIEYQGTKKVLKVLDLSRFNNREKKEQVIRLFKREAEILSRLNHPGIPRVEKDGYLELHFPNYQEMRHCLVMEKIEGINLQQWLENRGNQPITPEQAYLWLRQLVEILDIVHAQGFFHRDIKPANIMLRSSGELVLIDFGAVRELAQTYIQKEQSLTGTAIVSAGYTPREQEKGKAIKQSDFFALARTFVHLLTGIHPINLPEDYKTHRLIWRNKLPYYSGKLENIFNFFRIRALFDLLDKMMEPLWRNRPQNTQVILKNLDHKLPMPKIPVKTASAAALFVTLAYSWNWYTTGVNGCSKIWLRSFPQGDSMSCGEEILLPNPTNSEKQDGVQAIAQRNYQEAVKKLEKAWQEQPDPETLIYLNNARLELEKFKTYTIAVAAPISNNNDGINFSRDILQGIAQAQDEFNQNNKDKKIGLQVLIVNDNNQPRDAVRVVKELVKKRDVLAVVGHFRSDITIETVKVYQKNELLLISSTATSEDLSNVCQKSHPHCFFRVVPNNNITAQALAKYLKKENKQNPVVFFNPGSNYSKSLQAEMKKELSRVGGKVIAEIPLYENWEQNINQMQAKKADVIVLFPTSDGLTSDLAIQVIEYAKNNKYLIAGGDSLAIRKILKEIAENEVGSVIALPWYPGSTLNLDYTQQAKKLWGKPVNWHTALSYDATRTLLTALEQLPTPSRTSLKNIIADPNFKATGATGEIRFAANGNRKKPYVHLVKVTRNPVTNELEFQSLQQFSGN
ncbi:MAG: ABC transporter substrate-binding protein [Scytonematopsis contorta HA4267-MV1]|nr:ABC transporter substrate-binding protein [Scytonematopsis contorta HA4267-MV1]